MLIAGDTPNRAPSGPVNSHPGYRAPKKAVRAPRTSSRPTRGPGSYGYLGFSAVPRSGGGAGYGGGSGGGVGSNSRGFISRVATPAPPPPPPSLAQFLGKDSTYNSQISQLKRALAQYLAQQGAAKTQYNTGYATNTDTLKTTLRDALASQQDDFASRGLLTSGLFADAMSKTNTDFAKQQSALDQARAQYLAGLSSDLTNFKSEQEIAMEKAKQEAAARRAAQYSLG